MRRRLLVSYFLCVISPGYLRQMQAEPTVSEVLSLGWSPEDQIFPGASVTSVFQTSYQDERVVSFPIRHQHPLIQF